METAVALLVVALSLPAVSALSWTPALQDGHVIYACAGQDVEFPWGQFTTDPGDVINSVQWTFDGRSQELVGALIGDNFLPMPAFANRVQRTQGASLSLSHVTLGDSGNFSVAISGHDGSGSSFTLRHTLVLDVEDSLMTTDHTLHVTQEPVAMYSNSTDQWHAVLTCGHFTFHGDPRISVEWQTPSGNVETSTSYKDGNFYLLLPNPVADGSTYTCRIPRQQLPQSCLHGNGGEATLVVDGVTARLTVMEARQSALQDKNQQLENRVTSLQTDNQVLKTDNQVLKTDNGVLKNQVGALQTDNEILKNRVATLQHQVANLQGQDKANLSVAFFASLATSHKHLNYGDTLLLTQVRTNIGDGYDPSTGIFTVPVSGIYFFVGTASTGGSDDRADIRIVLDGVTVSVSYAYQASNQWQSGSCQYTQRLQQGQRVWLEAYNTGVFCPGECTAFSGFLIAVDP